MSSYNRIPKIKKLTMSGDDPIEVILVTLESKKLNFLLKILFFNKRKLYNFLLKSDFLYKQL